MPMIAQNADLDIDFTLLLNCNLFCAWHVAVRVAPGRAATVGMNGSSSSAFLWDRC